MNENYFPNNFAIQWSIVLYIKEIYQRQFFTMDIADVSRITQCRVKKERKKKIGEEKRERRKWLGEER